MSVIINMGSLGYHLLKKFDPGCMDFLLWLNSFEYAFDFMPSSKCSKAELIITFLEPSAQSILIQKVAPANVEDLTYDHVVCHLEELYSAQQGEHAANQRFVIRNQFVGETVLHYMYTLWKIAERGSDFIRTNSVLMERLRLGIKDERMKQILHQCEDLTFDNALIIAQSLD